MQLNVPFAEEHLRTAWIDDEVQCGARSLHGAGWYCTCVQGHLGPHVALVRNNIRIHDRRAWLEAWVDIPDEYVVDVGL